MLSDVLRERLLAVMRRWDADGDGVIQEDDYAIAAGRIAALGGMEPGSPEYEQLHAQLVDGGWALFREFDKDGDDRVTLEECLEGYEALYADPERYKRVIVVPSYSTFDLMDTDHDGMVNADEHRTFLIAMGVDEESADEAFPRMDGDGDGYVSREEFVQLMDEHFTSDDPDAAGAWMFGKL